MPDEIPVLIDFPDAVKGDGLDHSVNILHFEGEAVLFVESNLAKGDPEDLPFDVIFVPDLEDSLSRILYPSEFVLTVSESAPSGKIVREDF